MVSQRPQGRDNLEPTMHPKNQPQWNWRDRQRRVYNYQKSGGLLKRDLRLWNLNQRWVSDRKYSMGSVPNRANQPP
eukprot:9730571-Karenia_brevis.AAC.1